GHRLALSAACADPTGHEHETQPAPSHQKAIKLTQKPILFALGANDRVVFQQAQSKTLPAIRDLPLRDPQPTGDRGIQTAPRSPCPAKHPQVFSNTKRTMSGRPGCDRLLAAACATPEPRRKP
ncbi:MAG: hypothetical protein AB7S62_14615, partial [Azoarcus sp.]